MSSTHRLTRGSVRRALALSAAGAMVFALTPVQSAFATHGADSARDIQEAGDVCENAEGDAFDDITNDRIDAAADCLNDLNIARGYGDNEYRPGQLVNREQMASFISRKLDAAVEYDRPDDAPEANFTDRELIAQVHVNNVDILASLGVVEGFEDGSYRPGAAVTRGQMASFIVREMEEITGQELTATEDHFDDDDGTTHEDNINVLAEYGIAEGTAGGDFEPHASVTRGQMALFIARNVDALNDEFGISFERVVDESEIFIATRTVQPGDTITGVIGGNPTDVAVDGCGLANEALTDQDTTEDDFQFEFAIPTNQPAGECTLVFTFVDEAGTDQTVNVAITVEAAPGQQTATTRPELFRVETVRTFTNPGATAATTDDFEQTEVRYVFDEEVTGKAPAANLFHLTSNDPDVRFDGRTAVIESGNENAVIVTFGAFAADVGEAQLADVTVATVNFDAVRDLEGQENPIGDAPFGADRQRTAGQAGITTAPDLLTVSDFQPQPSPNQTTTRVTFTFDEAAFTAQATGFHLVTVNNQDIQCTAIAGQPGGNPGTNEQADTTIEVDCPETALGRDITAQDIARGYVEPGTVSDSDPDAAAPAADDLNPLQASNSPDAATDAPDLVSATFQPAANTTDPDRVVYTFDESVFLVTPAADATTGATAPECAESGTNANFQVAEDIIALCFFVYDVNADEMAGNAASRTGSNQITVEFTRGTLSDAVGASVEEGAVVGATGATGRVNQEDEVGVENQQVTNIAAGLTIGPDLVEVRIEDNGQRVVYVFDEDITTTDPIEAAFRLYQADGTRLECTGTATVATGQPAGQNNTVTCTQFRVDIVGGGAATTSQVASAVLGTTEYDAVRDADANPNPKGAELTTGGTGTPQQ